MVIPHKPQTAQSHRLLQAKPKGWHAHQHTFEYFVAADRAAVWEWLNTPETFTNGQPPFYKVEFTSPDPERIPAGFYEDVQNVHHGPFLNFAGVLTEIREGEYRDLQYYYGSYALTMWWIRPTRLQFWVEDVEPGITRVRGQVDSYVKPWIGRLWGLAQRFFWGSFQRLVHKSLESSVPIGQEPTAHAKKPNVLNG